MSFELHLEKIDRLIMTSHRDRKLNTAQQGKGKASIRISPDSKVHGANMGPTWDLSAPDGPHVGPMNLAIRENISLILNDSQSWASYVPRLVCICVTAHHGSMI